MKSSLWYSLNYVIVSRNARVMRKQLTLFNIINTPGSHLSVSARAMSGSSQLFLTLPQCFSALFAEPLVRIRGKIITFIIYHLRSPYTETNRNGMSGNTADASEHAQWRSSSVILGSIASLSKSATSLTEGILIILKQLSEQFHNIL